MTSTLAWIFVIAAGVNTCIANLFLKQSRLVAQGDDFVSSFFSPWFLGGIAIFGVNVILFAKALDRLPVSAAYPVLAGLGFGLLAIAGGVIFDERLNPTQWVGVGAILAGIILVSRS